MEEIQLTGLIGSVPGSFSLAGEIRFGPYYYSLRLPPYDFAQRIFGSIYLWSPDARFLAFQEWFTTDYAAGPLTGVLLIDFALGRQCLLSKASKGFVVPLRFDPPQLVYSKESGGKTTESRIAYEALGHWSPIPQKGIA